MNRTGIEYLTHSWNPLAMRCSKVSDGCVNCWHLAVADRLAKNPIIPEFRQKAYAGGDPVLIEDELEAPLKLKKSAIIGTQFMGDLFHDKVAVDHIDRIMDIIARCPQHTFVVLTKRPENIEEKLFTFYHNDKKDRFQDDYLPKNVWLGVTCENQKAADERLPILFKIPAAVYLVSIEPMLSDIDLGIDIGHGIGNLAIDRLNWVIVGGESGPGARPMHPIWVRSIRDQCQESGTPFFFKQWGEWIQCNENELVNTFASRAIGDFQTLPAAQCFKRVGKKKAGRILDGKEWMEFPV